MGQLQYAVCLSMLALVGCSSNQINGFYGLPTRAEREARNAAADHAKCAELGFKPGTEEYGNCRLQLEQIRATHAAAAASRQRAVAVDDSGKRDLTLLCKDAISRGDNGGVFVRC